MLDYSQFYCRGAREDELDKLAEVTESAFGVARSRNFREHFRFHIQKFEDNRIIVKKTDQSEEIVGSCPIVQYPFHLGPVTLKSGGIWMFGIAQPYKKKGLGQILLEDCNNYLTGLGYDVNLLFTGSPAFYRHKGYELCNLKPKFSISFQQLLSQISSKLASEYEFVPLQFELLSIITEIYEKFNQTHPLSRVRSLQYWQQYFNANRNGIQSSVFLIKGQNQYLGYVWCNRHENQLNIPEYAIDTTLPEKEQKTIENALLNFVITKFQPLGVESLSITLFSVFPLVQHIVTYDAMDLTSVISSLMVVILNLNQFLLKFVEFLRVVRIPQISSQWIKEQGDFNVGLQIEDQILEFQSKKNGISIHLNPEHKPERIVSIIRRIFGILVFGNFTPQELIECEYWNCPSDLLSIFQTFFPHLEGLVYPLDGF